MATTDGIDVPVSGAEVATATEAETIAGMAKQIKDLKHANEELRKHMTLITTLLEKTPPVNPNKNQP